MVARDQQTKDFAQFDERVCWFYEAIDYSVGMQGKTAGFGQVYLDAAKDQAGAWLDGGESYRLRVPPNAPVEQFWSVTLYDNLTRRPLLSPQGAADISSRKEGLDRNGDGSVDLYFGPAKPPGSNLQCQLRANGSGQGLVHVLPALWPDRGPYFNKQ